MLETIRDCIDNLPDKDFSEFYQDYVMESESKLMKHRLKIDSHRFTSIDSMSTIITGLNQMTEELKSL